VAVGRELTKIYEEVIRGKASEIIEKFKNKLPKGEMVVIINGNPADAQSGEI